LIMAIARVVHIKPADEYITGSLITL
jgi:hypothetical protein